MRVFLAALLMNGAGLAAAEAPPPLTVTQRLGERVAADTAVIDETGHQTTLKVAVSGRAAVLLLPVYFRCPNLCGLGLGYLARSVHALRPAERSAVSVAVISVDPSDTPTSAHARRQALAAELPADVTLDHWQFLTLRPGDASPLLASLGVPFVYDKARHEYQHPSVAVMLDGSGTIRQYVFGLEFPSAELNAGIKAVRGQRNGRLLTRFLLACLHLPTSGRYGLAVRTAVRGSGLLSLIGLGALLVGIARRRRVVPGRNERPLEGAQW